MSLTDNPNTKKRKPPVRSIAAKTNQSWSDKQKTEAVQHYLLLGNMALTSRILGIPEITLRVWKRSEWWNNLVQEIKSQETIQLNGKLKKIVEASLSAVEDRLANGDFQFDQKTGQVVRKPVNMKDAHKVAVDLMERQEMLEKKVSPIEDTTSDDNRLEKLAEKFAKFVVKSIDQKEDEQRTIDVVDVEIKDE